MRLYTKLLLLILVFGTFQQVVAPGVEGCNTWFLIRCLVADVLHDERLILQLADEHYRRHHTSDDDVEDHIEAEIRLAAR